MNICLVSQEFPPETAWGGIGTQTWNKAHALARLGHNVHVLSRAATEGIELRTEQAGGITVHRFQPPGIEFPVYGRSAYLLGYSWSVLKHLLTLLETTRFDVIDFAEFGAEGFAYLLDRTTWNWAAVVVQLHGPLCMFTEKMGWPARGGRFHRFGVFTEEMCVHWADALMACSANIADLTSQHYGVPREAIDVVHCGVDATAFRPPAAHEPRAERPTVLFVGNVVKNKGVHTAFDAVLRLRHKYPDIQLQILGKIPGNSDLMAEFRARLEAEQAWQHVDFVGFTPPSQLPEYYRRAHVFCSPAEFEGGVANVYLEAMASACPVVASTAGGGPEAVSDGQTGFLVPPHDAAATAHALDRVLASAELRAAMGVAARRRVEEYFALDKYIERVLAVYERAIERARERPELTESMRD